MAAEPERLDERVNVLETDNVVLRNALAVAGFGLWSWDFEDTLTCDARASGLLGLARCGEVTVADFLVQFKEEEHVRLLDVFERARQENGAFDELFELDAGSVSKGQQLRFQGQVTADGKMLSGICGLVKMPELQGGQQNRHSDVLSKVRMDQQLRLSSDMYLELDNDGYIQWSNPRAESVLGFDREALIGRSFLEFLHPEDIKFARQLIERVLSGAGAADQPFEYRWRCQSGDTIWLSWMWAVDATRGLLCAIARDVTEAKLQQEQLTATLAQVQDSNVELQSFASVASHDLREPLRMISSYLRLLQERSPDALDARAQRYINYACEGADRMRSLIEDLLSYSRLDSSTRRFEPVALDEVLEGAIGNLAEAIKQSGAEVTVDINNSPVVSGDRNRLVRLFQNLLANSIKFHREGSTPRVAVGFVDGNVAGEPDRWVVTIQDNGIGIDPDHQDLLFNVFQRLNTRDEFEGSGIGLAVCKKIAEQHDGRIWFASEVGKGSTFYVTLAKLQEPSIRG
jgi:PAS domain S-box-containing protein